MVITKRANNTTQAAAAIARLITTRAQRTSQPQDPWSMNCVSAAASRCSHAAKANKMACIALVIMAEGEV